MKICFADSSSTIDGDEFGFVGKVAFLSTFGTTIELFCILKVDDAYQLQENAAIQQIIDNKYLKSFKADRLKVVDPIAKVPG